MECYKTDDHDDTEFKTEIQRRLLCSSTRVSRKAKAIEPIPGNQKRFDKH